MKEILIYIVPTALIFFIAYVYSKFKKKKVYDYSHNNGQSYSKQFLSPLSTSDKEVSDAQIIAEADELINNIYTKNRDNKSAKTPIGEKTEKISDDNLDLKSGKYRFSFPKNLLDGKVRDSVEKSVVDTITEVMAGELGLADNVFKSKYISSMKYMAMFDERVVSGRNISLPQSDYMKDKVNDVFKFAKALDSFDVNHSVVFDIYGKMQDLSMPYLLNIKDWKEDYNDQIAISFLHKKLEDGYKQIIANSMHEYIKGEKFIINLYSLIIDKIKGNVIKSNIEYPSISHKRLIDRITNSSFFDRSTVVEILDAAYFIEKADYPHMRENFLPILFIEVELLFNNKSLHYLDYAIEKLEKVESILSIVSGSSEMLDRSIAKLLDHEIIKGQKKVIVEGHC